ncbi:MAG: hypothetical protein ACI30B_06970 [Paludibacteraceae bacterium]
MKISIKKYWWVALVILMLPIAINFILLTPSFTAIVGDEIAWLSFWGGYLGAIISATAAFVILYIQRKDNEKRTKDNEIQNKNNRIENEKHNKANRQLQLNIMKYQQQSQWLDRFRDAILECCRSLNSNDLILVSNMMWLYPHDSFNILKGLFDNIDKAQNKFAFVRKQNGEADNLAKYINERAVIYKQSLNDLQWIILYYKSTPPEHRCKNTFIKYLQSCTDKNANTNHILQISHSQVESIVSGNNSRYFNDIFLSIYTGLDKICDEIREELYTYIKYEQERTDNLLTENIES